MSDLATWLYVLRPVRPGMLTEGPTPAEQATVERHFAHLMELTKTDRVLLFGRTANDDERAMGLVVFEAPDEAAAREVMDADPAVVDGVMTGELFPYRVAYRRTE